MKYPKRSQYKYAKSRYRVRTWAEYEAGLQKRGDLTVWLMDGVLHSKWRVDDVLLEFHGHPAPPELQSFRGYEVDQSGLDPVPAVRPGLLSDACRHWHRIRWRLCGRFPPGSAERVAPGRGVPS